MQKKELEEFQESINAVDAKMDLLMAMEPSRLEMVKWKRDFLKQLIILSAWIIAFAIPILDKWWIIKSECIYYISLIGFIVTIISWIIYRYCLNKQEQNIYKDFIWFAIWIDLQWDSIESIWNTIDSLNNMKWNFPNPIKFHKLEKYIQLSLMILFIISLILLIISII